MFLLLEAMALERPVIASGVGGILTVLDNNNAGLAVPASDSRVLADAILKLITDPDGTRRMAQAGRSLVEQRFSLNRMLNEMTALYSEICGGAATAVRLPQATSKQDQS